MADPHDVPEERRRESIRLAAKKLEQIQDLLWDLPPSRELALTRTKVDEAAMWIAKVT